MIALQFLFLFGLAIAAMANPVHEDEVDALMAWDANEDDSNAIDADAEDVDDAEDSDVADAEHADADDSLLREADTQTGNSTANSRQAGYTYKCGGSNPGAYYHFAIKSVKEAYDTYKSQPDRRSAIWRSYSQAGKQPAVVMLIPSSSALSFTSNIGRDCVRYAGWDNFIFHRK